MKTQEVIILSGILLGVKILLIHTPYRSTDFDVHRNWLAITNNLPLNKWYSDRTSKWTLDYPPFFAWFEYFLSMLAPESILKLQENPIQTEDAIWFQKWSVILSDFVLLYATYKITKNRTNNFNSFLALAGNVGLIMVDHIHFQYNGMLFGFLVLSIANYYEKKIYWSAFWFAVLLNFKHLFLYIAPAFGLVMLQQFVKFDVLKLLKLGIIVTTVFAASFLPFVDHLDTVLKQLFPFKRGLTHIYWAPNFWALYTFADSIYSKLFLGKSSSFTGGVIEDGDQKFNFLPEITPLHCAILSFGITIIGIQKIMSNNTLRDPKLLIKSIVFSGWTCFMFGWHVHEKAILTVIIPLTILNMENFSSHWWLTTCIGHFSLFGLFFTPWENTLKILLLVAFQGYFWTDKVRNDHRLIAYGCALVWLYVQFGHDYIFGNTMEFLPLMATSVYSTLGLGFAYLEFCYVNMFSKPNLKRD